MADVKQGLQEQAGTLEILPLPRRGGWVWPMSTFVSGFCHKVQTRESPKRCILFPKSNQAPPNPCEFSLNMIIHSKLFWYKLFVINFCKLHFAPFTQKPPVWQNKGVGSGVKLILAMPGYLEVSSLFRREKRMQTNKSLITLPCHGPWVNYCPAKPTPHKPASK